MISVTNVRVVGFDRHYLDVYWEVPPTLSDIQEYEFTVQRSESEAGAFEDITGALKDTYFFRDYGVPPVSVNRVLFYRIKVRHAPSGEVVYSSVSSRRPPQDLIAREIVRLETLLFEEFAGTMGWLFPRRTFGQRCPQCWDDVLQKVVDDRCPVCFGTGFSGGYHRPIQFFVQVDESPTAERTSPPHHHQQKTFSIRSPASPFVKPLDLFIDNRNRRMRVLQVHGTHRLNTPVRQEFQAALVQPGSIEDAVPLEVDAATLEMYGWRNFTNPQNMEAVTGAHDPALDALIRAYDRG